MLINCINVDMDMLQAQAMALQRCELELCEFLADCALEEAEVPLLLKTAQERLYDGWELFHVKPFTFDKGTFQ